MWNNTSSVSACLLWWECAKRMQSLEQKGVLSFFVHGMYNELWNRAAQNVRMESNVQVALKH